MEEEIILGELSEKYGKICRTIVKNILHNDEDAEEILNDSLLAFWNFAFEDFPENPGAWLCKTARNLALNRLEYLSAEKRGRGNAEVALSELEECIPSKNSVEEKIDEAALLKSIEDFLRSESREKRNIFIRRYWYMFSVSEISKAYGISESKVKSTLFRMRKELRKKLEKEELI